MIIHAKVTTINCLNYVSKALVNISKKLLYDLNLKQIYPVEHTKFEFNSQSLTICVNPCWYCISISTIEYLYIFSFLEYEIEGSSY